MGEVSRIIAVFTSPFSAFADIVKHPRWVIPLILMGVVGIVFTQTFSHRVGWESMIRRALESSSRGQNMTPAQMAQAVQTGARAGAAFGMVGGALGAAITCLVVALVLRFVTNVLMGADIRFGSMAGIVGYGYLPSMLATLLAMLVMFLKDPDDFDIRFPLVSNLGALMPPGANRGLTAFLGSFDIFALWSILLIAIGICSAAPKFRLPKALAAVGVPWGLYVILKTVYALASA